MDREEAVMEPRVQQRQPQTIFDLEVNLKVEKMLSSSAIPKSVSSFSYGDVVMLRNPIA
jgi:hypothetical protein